MALYIIKKETQNHQEQFFQSFPDYDAAAAFVSNLNKDCENTLYLLLNPQSTAARV